MRTWDELRASLAQAAYERDAHARWGASYFTPWEMLHESVRIHYRDAQESTMAVVADWLTDASSISTMAAVEHAVEFMDEGNFQHLLDDGWETRQESVDD